MQWMLENRLIYLESPNKITFLVHFGSYFTLWSFTKCLRWVLFCLEWVLFSNQISFRKTWSRHWIFLRFLKKFTPPSHFLGNGGTGPHTQNRSTYNSVLTSGQSRNHTLYFTNIFHKIIILKLLVKHNVRFQYSEIY